jgi:hypothetical protein
VDLEIWTPRLSLQLPELLVGIFLGVIGHFWQQGQIIEGFSILAEHGTFQREGFGIHKDQIYFALVFIDVFSLWRLIVSSWSIL